MWIKPPKIERERIVPPTEGVKYGPPLTGHQNISGPLKGCKEKGGRPKISGPPSERKLEHVLKQHVWAKWSDCWPYTHDIYVPCTELYIIDMFCFIFINIM